MIGYLPQDFSNKSLISILVSISHILSLPERCETAVVPYSLQLLLDDHLLTEVFENLLSNAMRYACKRIWVEVVLKETAEACGYHGQRPH